MGIQTIWTGELSVTEGTAAPGRGYLGCPQQALIMGGWLPWQWHGGFFVVVRFYFLGGRFGREASTAESSGSLNVQPICLFLWDCRWPPRVAVQGKGEGRGSLCGPCQEPLALLRPLPQGALPSTAMGAFPTKVPRASAFPSQNPTLGRNQERGSSLVV